MGYSLDCDPKCLPMVASERPENVSADTRERDVAAFDARVAFRPLKPPTKPKRPSR